MCLIVFAWDAHPDYRLVLAANRDELHRRPAKELHWWPDRTNVLAGRDLQAGGTWLAASRNGRFATVTNYREGQRKRAGLLSRGELVAGFVSDNRSPGDFLRSLDGDRYAGFSLLVTDGKELWCGSNRGDSPTRLESGIYGLSNAALDTPWPKLIRSRSGLESLLGQDRVNESELFRLLSDRTPAAVDEIDPGELSYELARAVSAPFIVSADYGTRCTTTVLWSADDKLSLTERRFRPSGDADGETRISYAADARNQVKTLNNQ